MASVMGPDADVATGTPQGNPVPATLAALFEAQCAARGEQLAYGFVRDDLALAEPLSYAQLQREARALAARLAARTGPGDRILLALPPGLDFVRAFWACLLAGRVAVPVPAPDPVRLRHAAPRLRAILGDAGAALVLTSGALREAAAALLEPAVFAAAPWVALADLAGDAAPLALGTDPDALAYLQYTSGSTMAPRGVCLSHAQVLAHARALNQHARLDADSRVLNWLPHFHDYGLVCGLLMPMVAGASSWLMSPLTFLRRPLRWLDALAAWRITHSGAPDSAYAACLRALDGRPFGGDLSHLVSLSCGAEPVRAETLEALQAALAPAGLRPAALVPAYGLAEAVLGVTSAALDRPARVIAVDATALRAHRVAPPADQATPARRLVGCGAPIPGTEVAIVDPATLHRSAADAVGEIWVRSASVGAGYWRQPASCEVFGARLPDGTGPFLRTGDLGFWHDGELFVTGRLKDLVILHGQNHAPQDLEWTAEQAHPDLRVGYGAAFAIDTPQGEGVVLALEVARRGEAFDAAALCRAVRRAIAQAHALSPETVVLVRSGALPRTSSGKIQRQHCRQAWLDGTLPLLHADQRAAKASATGEAVDDALATGMPEALDAPAGAADRVRPRDATEQALWDIWHEVLHTRAFGVHESFFELGGHSLLITQVASRVGERLGMELPLAELFEHTSIAALALHLGRLRRDPAGPARRPTPLHIARVPRGAPLPVSLSQRRMWVVQQFDPASVAYNVALPLRLRGPLAAGRLQHAIDRLVARHEGLRTHFTLGAVEPQQCIRSALRVELERIDLGTLPADQRLDAARAWVGERARQPFDLTRAPLHRPSLLRLADDDHVLLWLMHHAVSDNWALVLLLRELLALYADGSAAGPLPPLDLAYADYASWQRSPAAVARRQPAMQYWRERLRGLAPLALPTDFPRPPAPSFRGGKVSAALPPGLRHALQAFGARHAVTPFVVYLAAFKLMLARQSQGTDIAVGTPIANRHHLATEALFGTLVNTLVMRTDLSDDPSFEALVRRVRDTAIAAYAHQEAPFDELVEALGRDGLPHPEGLVRVLFNVLNAPIGPLAPVGLELEELDFERSAAQFDLSIHIDTEFSQRIHLEYATDLYARVSAERLLDNYLALLGQLLADPARPLSRYAVVSPAQLAMLRDGWNATATPLPPALQVHQHLRTACPARPDMAALIDGKGQPLSYRELESRSNVLARVLRAHGLGRGQRVGLCLARDAGMLVALLAVLKSGAAYVPLDPGFPPERLRYMAADAGLSLILGQAALMAPLAEAGVPLLDPEAARCAADLPDHALAPDAERDARPLDAAYLIYTSGSTGQPKGVAVPHRAVVNFLASMARRPGLQASDRLLAVTTLSFDIAVLELLLPLAVGACVIVADHDQAQHPAALRRLLERHQVTVMQATPSTWRLLLDTGWHGGASFRALIGGESLPPALAERLLAHCGALWNLYGPTETTVWSTCQPIVAPREGISIGRPIDNTTVWVLDPQGQPCPVGVPGEAWIGGLGVALGYHQREALTAERFVPDPWSERPGARLYGTGDRCRWRHDGLLEHQGRLDHQVKVRGFRIELGEIESVLLDHPQVAQCVAVTRTEREDDVRLIAYWVARQTPDGAAPEPAALREHLRSRLPEFMQPQHLVRLPALPQLPNGKIDRAALPAPAADEATRVARSGLEPPHTPDEQAVAAIWSRLLGVESIARSDNFLDLGGHSLLAMRAVAAMEQQLGWRIAPRRFMSESLAQIARRQDAPA